MSVGSRLSGGRGVVSGSAAGFLETLRRRVFQLPTPPFPAARSERRLDESRVGGGRGAPESDARAGPSENPPGHRPWGLRDGPGASARREPVKKTEGGGELHARSPGPPPPRWRPVRWLPSRRGRTRSRLYGAAPRLKAPRARAVFPAGVAGRSWSCGVGTGRLTHPGTARSPRAPKGAARRPLPLIEPEKRPRVRSG